MENATCVFIEEGANETVTASDIVMEEALATIKEEVLDEGTAVEVVGYLRRVFFSTVLSKLMKIYVPLSGYFRRSMVFLPFRG